MCVCQGAGMDSGRRNGPSGPCTPPPHTLHHSLAPNYLLYIHPHIYLHHQRVLRVRERALVHAFPPTVAVAVAAAAAHRAFGRPHVASLVGWLLAGCLLAAALGFAWLGFGPACLFVVGRRSVLGGRAYE